MAGIKGRGKNYINARRTKNHNSFSKIEGFEELAELFSSLAERSQDAYEVELEKAANKVMSAAENNVNSQSYSIASSIRLRKYSGGKRVFYKILAGGPMAPHAHLVEFGHRIINDGQLANMPGIGFRRLTKDVVVGDVPAHSFMRKAFDENKSSIEAAINAALDNLLKEV